MNGQGLLSKEYPGDAAWRQFVATFRGEWEARQDRTAYLAEIPDEEIAIVVSALMGAHGIEWMQRSLGALDDRAPGDVLASGVSGERTVRTLLMRMP